MKYQGDSSVALNYSRQSSNSRFLNYGRSWQLTKNNKIKSVHKIE